MAERRVPLGRATRWADLDELTNVSLAELEEARAFWADKAGRRWRILLETQVGVAMVQKLRALEKVIGAAAKQMERAARQLQAREISLAEWQLRMALQVKLIHLAAGAVATDGWSQLIAARFDPIRERLKKQYEFLRNFANQIEQGRQKLGRNFIRRARMYAGAARATVQNVRSKVMEVRGFVEEMRVLGVADHCPDCVGWAGAWAPMGTLPRIGDSVCQTFCHCRFKYRRADGTEAE